MKLKTLSTMIALSVAGIGAVQASHAATASFHLIFDKATIDIGESAHFTLTGRIDDNQGYSGIALGLAQFLVTLNFSSPSIVSFDGSSATPNDTLSVVYQPWDETFNRITLAGSTPLATNVNTNSLSKYKIAAGTDAILLEGDIVGVSSGTTALDFSLPTDTAVKAYYAIAPSPSVAGKVIVQYLAIDPASVSFTSDSLTVNAVPESASVVSLLVGCALLLSRRRK